MITFYIQWKVSLETIWNVSHKQSLVWNLEKTVSLVYLITPSKWSESHSVVSKALQPCGLHSPWNSPGQNTGVGSCSLLQGIFPTHGSKPGLLYCRQILYQQSHQGSPRILERVAYPFSSGSSQWRNQTGVSCIAGRFFTSWATREAPMPSKISAKKAKEAKKLSYYHWLYW